MEMRIGMYERRRAEKVKGEGVWSFNCKERKGVRGERFQFMWT